MNRVKKENLQKQVEGLEQQVEILEKLLKLKQAFIEELEAKVGRLESLSNPVWITPSVWPVVPQSPWYGSSPSNADLCTDGQPHIYPMHSTSTIPSSCTKCGKHQLAYPNPTFIATNLTNADNSVIITNGTDTLKTTTTVADKISNILTLPTAAKK